MNYLILGLICLTIWSGAFGQQKPQKPDSSRLKAKNLPVINNSATRSGLEAKNGRRFSSTEDSLTKIKLIGLALNNPQMEISDANIRIAKSDIRRAKSSWLSSLTASGNINEFVVQGSEGALYYPKYNFGVTLPFDIASKTKNQKKTAKENLIISEELKRDKEQFIRAQVLVAYENYKEKDEIVFIEKSYIEYEYAADEAAQKAFTEGDITFEQMNQTHQAYLSEKAKLVTKQRDLNVAIIELEQMIGVPLTEALKTK